MTAICQIYPHRKGLDRGAVRPCVGLLPHPSTSSSTPKPPTTASPKHPLESEPCPESAERVLPKNANSGGKIIHLCVVRSHPVPPSFGSLSHFPLGADELFSRVLVARIPRVWRGGRVGVLR